MTTTTTTLTTTALPHQPTAEQAPDTWGLVWRAQGEDRDEARAAFTELYRIYQPRVLRYAYRLVQGDRALAEDLTADVMLSAWRNIGRITWQGSDYGAWLTTITRNRVIDHFKRQSFRRETLTDEPMADGLADADPLADLDRAASSRVIGRQIMAALATLPMDQRTCVALRFISDLPLVEVAARMGRTEGAIKALQNRAVTSLRKALIADGLR